MKNGIVTVCIVGGRDMEFKNLLDIYSTGHVCNGFNGAREEHRRIDMNFENFPFLNPLDDRGPRCLLSRRAYGIKCSIDRYLPDTTRRLFVSRSPLGMFFSANAAEYRAFP